MIMRGRVHTQTDRHDWTERVRPDRRFLLIFASFEQCVEVSLVSYYSMSCTFDTLSKADGLH